MDSFARFCLASGVDRNLCPGMAKQVTYAADCRRVLENSPAGPEDYEIAAYLFEIGLARGKPMISRQRETYGQVIEVVWLGITPAGRLWLESESTRAELDQAEILKHGKSDCAAKHLEQEALNPATEAIAGLPKPPSNLVTIAIGVIVVALGSMVILLFKTHLGIPL